MNKEDILAHNFTAVLSFSEFNKDRSETFTSDAEGCDDNDLRKFVRAAKDWAMNILRHQTECDLPCEITLSLYTCCCKDGKPFMSLLGEFGEIVISRHPYGKWDTFRWECDFSSTGVHKCRVFRSFE